MEILLMLIIRGGYYTPYSYLIDLSNTDRFFRLCGGAGGAYPILNWHPEGGPNNGPYLEMGRGSNVIGKNGYDGSINYLLELPYLLQGSNLIQIEFDVYFDTTDAYQSELPKRNDWAIFTYHGYNGIKPGEYHFTYDADLIRMNNVSTQITMCGSNYISGYNDKWCHCIFKFIKKEESSTYVYAGISNQTIYKSNPTSGHYWISQQSKDFTNKFDGLMFTSNVDASVEVNPLKIANLFVMSV